MAVLCATMYLFSNYNMNKMTRQSAGWVTAMRNQK